MNDTITISKAELEAALSRWELAHRAGETRTYAETQALPPDQVARESAEYLWSLLSPVTA
jgi:hypothetical protein